MIEAKTKHPNIEQADKAEHDVKVGAAVRKLLEARDISAAAILLAKNEHFKEAGLLLLTELEELLQTPEKMSDEQRQSALMSAYYFQKAGRYHTATEVLMHLGEESQAKSIYEICWDRFSACSSKSPEYKEACRVLISVACLLDDLPSELAVFLSSFLAAGPKDEQDAQAFYEIGKYYCRKELLDHARMIFESLAEDFGPFRDSEKIAEKLRSGKKGDNSFQSYELSLDVSIQAAAVSSATQETIRELSNGVVALPPRISPPPSTSPSSSELDHTTEVPPICRTTRVSRGGDKSDDLNVNIQTMEHAIVRSLGARRNTPKASPTQQAQLREVLEDATMEHQSLNHDDGEATFSERFPTADTLEHKSLLDNLDQARHRMSSPPTIPMETAGSDTFIQVDEDATQEHEVVAFSSMDSFDVREALISGGVECPGDLIPGVIVGGRYKILDILGRGGMATVYRAIDNELDEEIALKVFEVTSNFQEGLQRLKKELKLSRRLSHPNIIRLHDIGGHEGYHYLSMELLKGIDLETLLEKRGVVSVTQGLDILLQICLGLQAVHEKGVIHRDLKPSNIFLTQEGVVKLMDFGIATHHTSSRLTAEGVVVGTAAYMAPERVTGRKDVSILGDMYAMGVIAFEMFTGQLPYYHDKIMRLFLMHVNNPIPSPRNLNPDIPIGLAYIIKTLMSKNPNKRINTCAELAESLRAIPSS